MANKFRSLPDLDNGSGNTRSLRSGWDEFGNPCTKLASTGGPGAGADGLLTTLASVFLPVEASACDVGGRPRKKINQSVEPILKNGYYEVNGFKFTEYYYKRLIDKKYSPSLIAREILDNGKLVGPDPQGYPGFNKYVTNNQSGYNWEMIYNPKTGEVQHLQIKP